MNTRRIKRLLWAAACTVGVLSSVTDTAEAQSVIGSPVPNSPTPPGTSSASRSRSLSLPLSNLGSAFSNMGPLVKWGPVSVRPHILHTLSYGDGLLNPTQIERQSSVINTTVAGVQLEIGTHWMLSYAMTRNEYSNQYLTDSLDHDANIGWSLAKGDWTFGLSQSYRTNTPLLAETGQQTEQVSYSTSANVTYQLGAKSMVEVSVGHNTRLANSEVNSPQWTTSDWYSTSASGRFLYRVSPLLQLFSGLEYTYDRISGSPDMNAIQPHVGVTWRPTPKVSLNARVGTERRRVEGDTVSDLSNPVYSASLQYEPFDTTTISFSASQTTSASFFANLASKSSSYGVNLSQRLLQRFYLSLGYSTGETSYIATTLNFIDGRKDEFTSYNARLGTTILSRGSIAVFAQRSLNSSNTKEFDFTSDQIGVEIGYRF